MFAAILFRAFPVFYYGQSHMLGVEAWLVDAHANEMLRIEREPCAGGVKK